MLNEDYKEMLFALQSEQVDYILVGAYALAAHGYPRATLDIDIWVKPSTENADKTYKALAAFGAPLEQISIEDFEKNDTVFQIGVAPRRIDILTGITAVDYEGAKNKAVLKDIDGIKLYILSVEDLIQNKLATGRPKDLADAQTLKNKSND